MAYRWKSKGKGTYPQTRRSEDLKDVREALVKELLRLRKGGRR